MTTSKKQLCETSSIFEFDNIKNEAILRDILQKLKVECRADGLVPVRVAIFPFHPSKVLRLPRKSDARSSEELHLSRTIILANLKIWCSKMQPLWGNQCPDLLTSLMNMSLVLRLPRDLHLCGPSSNAPRLPWFLEMLQNPDVVLTFWQGAQSVAPAMRNDIWTSKSGPKPSVSNTFDFEMCFVPQRRALFEHLNSQVLWTWRALYILTAKCASRHKVVDFSIISTSKSAPRLKCLYTFDFDMCFATTACNFSSLIWPDGSAPAALASLYSSTLRSHKSLEKQSKSRFFYFSRTCIFFLLTLFLLWSSLFFLFPPLLFHLSILSEDRLLNFLRSVHHHMNSFVDSWIRLDNIGHCNIYIYVCVYTYI